MPDIKCHHGCSMSVGTDQWVSTLTIDQMRYARAAMETRSRPPRNRQNLPYGLYVVASSARRTTAKRITKRRRTISYAFTKNDLCQKPQTGLRSRTVTRTSRETCHISLLNELPKSGTTLNGSPRNPKPPSASLRDCMETPPWKPKSSQKRSWPT